MSGGRLVEAWLHVQAAEVGAQVEESCALEVLPLSVAGVTVDLVFAGPRLRAALGPALEHAVRADDEDARWRILLWDSDSGHPMPAPPVYVDFTPNGEAAEWGRLEGRRTSFHYGDWTVTMLDVDRRRGWLWVEDADQIPTWSRSAPCRALLSWILEAEGRLVVHGAAVADPESGRGALLLGPGGSGKSTTTSLSVAGGLVTCGDDHVALSTSDAGLRAHALFGRAKLVPAEVDGRPDDWTSVEVGPDGKTVLDVTASQGWVSELSIDLVVTPRPGGGASVATPVLSSQALAAGVVPTTEQISWWRGEDVLWRMLSPLPAVDLALGPRDQVADHIRTLLAYDGSGRPAPGPGVSVVVPFHRGLDLLAEAVASVHDQDVTGEVEVVVVDDGSATDPGPLCRDLGVTLVRLSANLGPAAARNAGVRAASHDLIGFVDADDRWPAWSLGPRLRLLAEDPGLDVVQGLARLVDLEGHRVWEAGKDDFPYYIGTMLCRRRVLDEVGAFDESLRFGEDIDWFLRLAESGVAHRRLGLVTLDVRRHDRNSTRGRDVKELGLLRVAQRALARRRATP